MSELQQTLHELHRELAEARQLAPEDRALLEAAVAEIRQALAQTEEAPEIAPTEAPPPACSAPARGLPCQRGAIRPAR